MGLRAALGQPMSTAAACQVGQGGEPDSEAQDVVATWKGNPVRQRNSQWNRQFLANLAIRVVQRFRDEEAQLRETRSLGLADRRRANRRIALQLQDLMAAVEQGLEVTADIQTFLDTWLLHQPQPPTWRARGNDPGSQGWAR